jgi:hypothetical protein
MFEKLSRRFRRRKYASFTLDRGDSHESGPCQCCGDYTQRVSGFLGNDGRSEALYFVEWTKNKVAQHGAHVDLIIGPWADAAQTAERVAVSLELRHTASGPWFSVIDATHRQVAKSDLVGQALTREQVIGSPLAKRVFDMVDTIWCGDERIMEVKGGAAHQCG